jgi:flavin-dependent dehydrogenase
MSFVQDGMGVTVTTKEKVFRTHMLIGAEGAAGFIARTANLHDGVELGLAWESEVAAEPEDVKQYADTVFLDWGTLPGGYAWVFPKKDHFSIGVGGPASLSKAMMPYYERFLSSIGTSSSPLSISHPPASGIRFGETRSLQSWPIPVRTKKSRFHNGLVMVTGDAAGLGDPLTGEGIYYAVRSGKLAAETCIEYFSGRIRSMDSYSEKINDELMTELLEANRIKHIFNTVPFKIHSFLGESNRAWKAFCKILRGERWYVDVRSGFGKWKKLWNLVCYISGIIEKRKEKRVMKKSVKIKSWV